MSKTLEDRLSHLDIGLPPTLVPRVLAQAEQKRAPMTRHRVWRAPALAFVLALSALWASLYAAPRFADVLAAAPVIGGPTADLLHSVGLDPVANRLTPVDDVAVSAGYRIQLVAAYADATQTILIFRSNPHVFLGPGIQWPSSLTDQFGRQVQYRGGAYDSRVGAEVSEFDALPWPDDLLGARLTVHFASVQPVQLDPNSAPDPRTLVRGSWTLHATVAVEPGVNIRPLPSDGLLGGTTFQYTSIVRSGPSLEVEMLVRGPLATHLTDAVGEAIPNVSKPHQLFNIRLLDSTGTDVQELGGDRRSGPRSESVRNRWLVTTPGRYRLLVSFEGVGQFDRKIDVP